MLTVWAQICATAGYFKLFYFAPTFWTSFILISARQKKGFRHLAGVDMTAYGLL